ncbi:pyridoxamine 5'-phosphate oxidase family protein [Sphingomonas sp. GlSt437]|uniref:pyridoxamine 5'-phosphate oxidase family protein n=1 Tax=Sphingomonas sp. GlSt437 TaxID=3389970 RepID=UPI003A87B594
MTVTSDPAKILDQFLRELRSSPFVMIGLDDTPDHSQPMTAQLLDDEQHRWWFFTSRSNRLSIGGPAMAQFVAKGHDFFACVHGTLSESTDRDVIDRLWSNQVAAWFPGGKDDPDLLLLRYDLDSAEMWKADAGLVSAVTQVFGGLLGQSARPNAEHAEMPL